MELMSLYRGLQGVDNDTHLPGLKSFQIVTVTISMPQHQLEFICEPCCCCPHGVQPRTNQVFAQRYDLKLTISSIGIPEKMRDPF